MGVLPCKKLWRCKTGLGRTGRNERYRAGDCVFQRVHIKTLIYIVLFGFVAFVMPNTNEIIGTVEYDGRFSWNRKIVYSALFCIVALIATLFMVNADVTEFLYFNF